jgi:hypothetical protein
MGQIHLEARGQRIKVNVVPAGQPLDTGQSSHWTGGTGWRTSQKTHRDCPAQVACVESSCALFQVQREPMGGGRQGVI